MLYSITHMATVGVEGSVVIVACFAAGLWLAGQSAGSDDRRDVALVAEGTLIRVFSINNHRQQHSEVPYTRSPCS